MTKEAALYTVRLMVQDDYAGVLSFLAGHQDAHICYHPAWQRVSIEAMGQQAPWFVAEEAGHIVGLMPLALRKSRIFGHAAISGFVSLFGGPLASTPAIAASLCEAAEAYASEAGMGPVEVRLPAGYSTAHSLCTRLQDAGLQASVSEMASSVFAKDLPPSREGLLPAIPKKRRYLVRKSLEVGFQLLEGGAYKDTAYALYSRSVHRLGTPVFPQKLFSVIADAFGSDGVEFLIARTPSGDDVASFLVFYGFGTVSPFYVGGTVAARSTGAHDFLYYSVMERALARGITRFDFGRSRNESGPYHYKQSWGFAPIPLEMLHISRQALAPHTLDPQSAKFKLLSRVWKNMPHAVAAKIGPHLARHLG